MIRALMIAALLAGCGGGREEQWKPPAFDVQPLFTHDGCTVYRFDGMAFGGRHFGYFTNCKGTTEWPVGCGKGQTCTNTTMGGGE